DEMRERRGARVVRRAADLSGEESVGWVDTREGGRKPIVGQTNNLMGFASASHSAVHPPSMTSDDPVISEEASEARKTNAPVRSSTRPRRPSLILASTA